MKNNNIWLVNQDAMPPNIESRLRTIKFAHYLIKNHGFNVTIFASSVMHNTNIDLINDGELYIEKRYEDLKFVFIKTRKYSKSIIPRIIGLFEFPIKLHFIRNKFEKPNIIIHTANIPFDCLLFFTAKKMNARYILEILDLWPLTFVDLGLVKKNNLFLKIAFKIEKWQYNKAEKVVFSMEGGRDYIISQKWDNFNGGPIEINKLFYINGVLQK